MGTGPLVENHWSRYFQDHYCESNGRLLMSYITSPVKLKDLLEAFHRLFCIVLILQENTFFVLQIVLWFKCKFLL